MYNRAPGDFTYLNTAFIIGRSTVKSLSRLSAGGEIAAAYRHSAQLKQYNDGPADGSIAECGGSFDRAGST